MRTAATKNKSRVSAKEEEEEEQKLVKDGAKVLRAYESVDVQTYISAYKDFTLKEYRFNLTNSIRDTRPYNLEVEELTMEFWNDLIDECVKSFPYLPSKDPPQSFEDSDNNINKFFGNIFGNKLHRFFNTMGIYFAGIHTLLQILFTII